LRAVTVMVIIVTDASVTSAWVLTEVISAEIWIGAVPPEPEPPPPQATSALVEAPSRKDRRT
jgi:hypothetical protein